MNAQAPQDTTTVDKVGPLDPDVAPKDQAGNDAGATDEVPQTADEVVGATGVEDTEPQPEDAAEDGIPRQMEFVGPVLGSHEKLSGLFNTFRMGKKWADATPFEYLDLVVMETKDKDAKRHTLTGDTVVLAVHQGQLGDMIELHAGLNHGCSQAMPADRKAELLSIMREVYGNGVELHHPCTVVYVHRIVREG